MFHNPRQDFVPKGKIKEGVAVAIHCLIGLQWWTHWLVFPWKWKERPIIVEATGATIVPMEVLLGMNTQKWEGLLVGVDEENALVVSSVTRGSRNSLKRLSERESLLVEPHMLEVSDHQEDGTSNSKENE